MNITDPIFAQAKLHPNRLAIIFPVVSSGPKSFMYETLTYRQFVDQALRLAKSLTYLHVAKGSKVLLFVKPCLLFAPLVFALQQLGAIPVLIDPGVGRKNLLHAIEHVAPDVLIGEPVILRLRFLFRKYFRSVKCVVATRKAWFTGARADLETMTQAPATRSLTSSVHGDDPAAIVYTSGATGAPKGVVYTHSMFAAQLNRLNELIPQSFDVDLSCFPLFALFSLAMGKTSVIPHMDVTKPASCNPEHLFQHIEDFGIRMGTGSPAIWMRLVQYGKETGRHLPSMNGVIMFGAPVPLWLHEDLKIIMPDVETYTPYGATEALPVSWITGQELLHEHKVAMMRGAGVAVGKGVAQTKIQIIDADGKTLPVGAVGEIAASGPQVTRDYFHNDQANKRAKFIDANSQHWHRMGDLGFLDAEGRLWFCGRKAHSFDWQGLMYHSVPVELIFDQHPQVFRSALISMNGKPAVVMERHDRQVCLNPSEHERFLAELKTLGQKHDHTRAIDVFFLYTPFPVDCRHNIKIDREALATKVQGFKAL